MYTLFDEPAAFVEHNERAKELLAPILQAVEPRRAKHKIGSDRVIFDKNVRNRSLYLLTDGSVSYIRNDKTVYFYSEGDLFGMEHFYYPSDAIIKTEFAIFVDEYDAKQVLETIGASGELLRRWNEYLTHQVTFVSEVASKVMREEMKPQPFFCHYGPEETIIKQGDMGQDVYTLLEGHAEVFVDDVKVGEIYRDEIFGAIAALTDTCRTATVKTTQPSMALALPREKFVELIEYQPQTVLKMVEDMSRAIVDLNRKVLELKYIQG